MRRKALLLIFAFLFISIPVRAEENNVQQDQQSFQAYDLGEVVVSGKKTTVSNTAITTEITAQDIKTTNSHTVAEAMQYVPGIRVTTGRKNQPNVSIHGFSQSQVLVLIDGVPYYETFYRSLDLNQIPTDNIAKIVVTKGAASVLYGANAEGGVINIITKKATTKPTFEASFEASEHNTNRESVSHGMKTGIFSYWLNYSHQETAGWRLSDDFEPTTGTLTKKPGGTKTVVMEDGGYRDHSDMNSNDFWAKFGVEPSEDSEYYANFHYLDRERGVPTNIYSETLFASRPAFGLMSFPKYEDWGIDLSGRQKLTDQLTLRPSVFYHNHRDELDSHSDLTYSEVLAESTYKDHFGGGALLADYQPVNWDVLRFSIHYQKDSHEDRDDTYLPYAEKKSYTGSGGIENEFNLIKDLSVVTGASYDWFKVDDAKKNTTDKSGNFTGQVDQETPDTTEKWNPMLGLTYELNKDSKLFGSVARKTLFPSLFELYTSKGGNPDLNAEKSLNTTLGVSYSFADLAWAQVSYFRHDIKDFITRDTPDITGSYLNFGKIEMNGVEINTEFHPPITGLTLKLDYTYNNARDMSSDRVTDRVLNVPRNQLDMGIDYTVPVTNTRLNFNTLYVDHAYNQLPTPSQPTQEARESDEQVLCDIKVSQTFYRYFEAYVALNNIFDRNYESEWGFPAPGRNFWAGLTVKY